MNKTKIIATIGPSSSSRDVLKKMIEAGMNVARLNFSHGTYADHEKVISLIRSLAREMNRPVAILLDLQGPKIRVGKLKGGTPVMLKKNRLLTITTDDALGTADSLTTTYKSFSKDVKSGDRILLDDGLIELKVVSKRSGRVTCKVVTGGLLKEHKGMNLPGVKVSAPSLTQKDIKDLKFGISSGVDLFALSFVRQPGDLKHIKQLIRKHRSDIPVIAKIEKPEALEHLDSILEIADGIMVARGDLGVELLPEQVPPIQKHIIDLAVKANKPVITATQMLETMTENPIPTRAEASDVANAIYDGTDAIMLSAETASGNFPVKAIQMMSRIAAEAERSPFMKYNIQYEKDPEDMITHAVAQSSVNILHEVDAKAIVTFSVSGKTPKLISKQRPSKPVYAFTPFNAQYNRLALVWGVTPLLIKPLNDARRLIDLGVKKIVEKNYAKKDDIVIIVTGLALKSGSTNLIKIHAIGHED